MEPGPVAREPAIRRFFNRRHRPQPVGARDPGPAASHFSPHAIHSGSPLRAAPVQVYGPGRAISLFARDSVALQNPSFLVGDRQHTAGTVAPADPARHPGSNPSSPIEQEHEVWFCHTRSLRAGQLATSKRTAGSSDSRIETSSRSHCWPAPRIKVSIASSGLRRVL